MSTPLVSLRRRLRHTRAALQPRGSAGLKTDARARCGVAGRSATSCATAGCSSPATPCALPRAVRRGPAERAAGPGPRRCDERARRERAPEPPGLEAARAMAQAAEQAAALPPRTALVLPPVSSAFRPGGPGCRRLRRGRRPALTFLDAARAIMTTDSAAAKHRAVRLPTRPTAPSPWGGIAKGSGMIHPRHGDFARRPHDGRRRAELAALGPLPAPGRGSHLQCYSSGLATRSTNDTVRRWPEGRRESIPPVTARCGFSSRRRCSW